MRKQIVALRIMLVKSKTIAVDFDGTIVQDKYTGIGKPLPFAFETLRLLQQDGHRPILWTVRSGERLKEALDFRKRHGVAVDAVNKNFEGKCPLRKNSKPISSLMIEISAAFHNRERFIK